MPAEETDEHRIKTAVRVFDIVEKIRELRGATLTELSDALDVPKSTLHAYLSTIESLEYVDRTGDEYDLGLKYLDLGIYARNRVEMLSQSDQVLKDLAKESREVVWLAVENRGKVVYVATERDSQSVRTYEEVGKHEYMHCSASGKAILAHLSERQVPEIIDRYGLPAKTDNTITEAGTLFEELASVRERGYAMNDQETAEGISAISAPVVVDDAVHGSVTVAGPANRINEGERMGEIVRLVKGASEEIELNMKYS